MKKLLMVFSCFVVLFVVAGCNNNIEESDTIVVTDMLGETVEITKSPEKVACISRAMCDYLIAFGVGDKVDGVYKTILDNEWLNDVYPDADGYYSYQYEENYETFISREVDLIISPEARITTDLKDIGLPAVTANHYGNPTYDDYMFYMVDLIETLWGDDEDVMVRTTKWKNDFNEAKSAITTELAKHQIETKTLYYVRGDKNRGIGYTENTKPYAEYIYRLLEVEHVGHRFETNKPSSEEIIAIDPDIIIIGGIYQHVLENDLKTDPVWSALSAVNNDNIYRVPIGITGLEQTSSMSPIFLYDQANKLYPAYFDFDIEQMLKDDYLYYFGYALSDEEVGYIIDGKNRLGENLR